MARNVYVPREFLQAQAQLECFDCVHAHLSGPPGGTNQYAHRRIAGGGTIVWSKHSPIREFHIVPHGGTELPGDFFAEHDPGTWGDIAQLIHLNADTGTNTIYTRLAEQIGRGELPGTAVAGFHLSRLLLDANRGTAADQVPLEPYVGDADLYQPYLLRHGDRLRREYLNPWLGAVNAFLAVLEDFSVVYHHHTYDLTSMSSRPYDFADKQERPAFELVWKRPDDGTGFESIQAAAVRTRRDWRGGGLAPLEDLKEVRDAISTYLMERHEAASVDGYIDYPLELPLAPFEGTRRSDWSAKIQHVIYDMRKDYLDTAEKVRDWVDTGPWRLGATH